MRRSPTWSTATAKRRWRNSAPACRSARGAASSPCARKASFPSSPRTNPALGSTGGEAPFPDLFQPALRGHALLAPATAGDIEVARDLGLALDVVRFERSSRPGDIFVGGLAYGA